MPYRTLPPLELSHVAILPHKLRLTFGGACDIPGNIDVLARGILISSTTAGRVFGPGEFIDLPVRYFPNLPLPVCLRICTGEEEIATPVIVNSNEEIMMLIGHGDIEAENLSLEAGLLRGILVLNSNGVSIPHAFIRINGLVIRSVVVEPPVARDTGGAVCRFAVPIRPADFVESGLSIDLYVNGIDYPLASFAYERADCSGNSKRLINLEEELRRLHKSSITQIEMISANFERRLRIQQERIDAFIDYAISILLDNLTNAFERKSDPVAFVQALTQARQSAVEETAVTAAAEAIRSAELKIESSHLAFGWYDLEHNKRGPFRWMGQTALVNNPYPNLPISKVEFHISRVYGASEPLLRGFANDVELNASTTKRDGDFLVCFTAPAIESGVLAQSLRIESFHAGSPAVEEGTKDNRTLSIAVLKCEFYYLPVMAGEEIYA